MLVLPPELTHRQAVACLRMLVQGLPAHAEEVVVDAEPLTRFDSSALAVLIEFRRETLRRGKAFEILGLAPKLLDLARLYGVAELIEPAT